MPKVPDCVQRIRTYRQYPTYGTTLRVDIHFSRELMDLRLFCSRLIAHRWNFWDFQNFALRRVAEERRDVAFQEKP
jgi:hypothetical protein